MVDVDRFPLGETTRAHRFGPTTPSPSSLAAALLGPAAASETLEGEAAGGGGGGTAPSPARCSTATASPSPIAPWSVGSGSATTERERPTSPSPGSPRRTTSSSSSHPGQGRDGLQRSSPGPIRSCSTFGANTQTARSTTLGGNIVGGDARAGDTLGELSVVSYGARRPRPATTSDATPYWFRRPLVRRHDHHRRGARDCSGRSTETGRVSGYPRYGVKTGVSAHQREHGDQRGPPAQRRCWPTR